MMIQRFSFLFFFFFQKHTYSFTGPDKLLNGQNLARIHISYTHAGPQNRASFLPDQQKVKNFDRFGSSTMKMFAQFTR